jgi:hypothetical protein
VSLADRVASVFKASSLWNPKGGAWLFEMCTFVNCSGSVVIWSETPFGGSKSRLAECNFVDNMIAEFGAILYSTDVGLLVKRCYFGGQSQAHSVIVYLDDRNTAESERFEMINCIFAGKEPNDAFCGGNTGNTVNVAAPSLDLSSGPAIVCPDFTPRPTVTPAPTVACSYFSGLRQARVDVSVDKACCVLADCFFDHVTHSEWGGAVKLGTNTDQLNLSSTTFLNCRSTNARGGALYLGCLFTEMKGCCIRNTSSEGWGTAIEGQRDDAVHVFRDSSFVDCGSPELDGDGTIYIDRRTHLGYSLLNFSSCSFNNGPRGTGAVVRFDGSTELPWSLRYCTILGCCGKTGIHSQSAMDGLVDHCNFYNNVADSDRGFVYGAQNGFVVSSCVFNNGTGLDLFLLGSGRTKFTILKCVFSVTSLSSDYFEDSSTDNVVGSTTASIVLDHFHTYYCPTAPPCLSPTLFVSASQAVFSSAQLKTSESFVSVKPWKPSGFDISSNLSSVDFTVSRVFFVNSVGFSASVDLLKVSCLASNRLLQSSYFASDRLLKSPHFNFDCLSRVSSYYVSNPVLASLDFKSDGLLKSSYFDSDCLSKSSSFFTSCGLAESLRYSTSDGVLISTSFGSRDILPLSSFASGRFVRSTRSETGRLLRSSCFTSDCSLKSLSCFVSDFWSSPSACISSDRFKESSGLAGIGEFSVSTLRTETVLPSQSAAFFPTDTVFDPPGSQADDGVGLSGASVGGRGLVVGVSMGIFGGLAILGLFLLLILRRKRSDDPFGNPFPGEGEGDGEIFGEEAEEVFDDDYENPLSGEGGIASVADAFHFAQDE